MANLGTWKINTNKEYLDIEELFNITLKHQAVYTIQPIDSKIYFRRGLLGKGFKVLNNNIFGYTHDQDNICYINTPHGEAEINIDEYIPESN